MSQIASNEALSFRQKGRRPCCPRPGRRSGAAGLALLLISPPVGRCSCRARYFATPSAGGCRRSSCPSPGRVVARGDRQFSPADQLLKDSSGFRPSACCSASRWPAWWPIPLGIVMAVWAPAKAVDGSVRFAAAPAAVDHLDPADHALARHRGSARRSRSCSWDRGSISCSTPSKSTKRVDPLLIRAARHLGASDLHVSCT